MEEFDEAVREGGQGAGGTAGAQGSPAGTPREQVVLELRNWDGDRLRTSVAAALSAARARHSPVSAF